VVENPKEEEALRAVKRAAAAISARLMGKLQIFLSQCPSLYLLLPLLLEEGGHSQHHRYYNL